MYIGHKLRPGMEITDKELCEEIKKYCKLNGLKFHDFTNKLLKEAFMREKYGSAPPFMKNPQKKSTFAIKEEEPIKQEPQTIVVKTEPIKEKTQIEKPLEIQEPVQNETKVKPKKHTLH